MAVGLTSTAPEVSVGSEKGLVEFLSNSDLDRIADEAATVNKVEEKEVTQGPLVGYVRASFESAKQGKQEIETKLLSILRQIKGEYEPDKAAAITSFGGSSDYIKITQHKVRDTEAWIMDIINPYGEKTWGIEPTPIADIPPEILDELRNKLRSKVLQQRVTQAATQGVQFDSGQLADDMEAIENMIVSKLKKRAQALAVKRSNNMKRKIFDQLEEGGWDKAFKACINDLSRMKSCVMKGPVFKQVPRLKWGESAEGKVTPEISTEVIPTFSRVSPFDWYPAATSSEVNDGDSIEIEHIKISELYKVMKAPGYRTKTIKEMIKNYPNGYKEDVSVATERQDLEKDNSMVYSSTDIIFDMINFWGIVRGEELLKYGQKMLGETKVEEDNYYNVNIKVIANEVIKDPVLNPNPLGSVPYAVSSFVKNNDSQWGDCPAELMEDIQGICNATVRALVNNIAISSGPVTEIDADRIFPGESGDLWPHKKILTTNKKMQEGPAINFYQAKLLGAELLNVYEKFKREADDLVVPSYGRSDIGGAGRTSSGLAMLMGAAARNIKLAIYNIDQDIILPSIHRIFNHNMLYVDDDSIKGDIQIKAFGTGGVIAKEQLAIRRKEFRDTLRPADEQLMGTKGIAYLLSKELESLDIDISKAIPAMEAINELDDLTPPPVPPAGGPQGVAPTPAPAPAILDVAGQQAGGPSETSLFRDTATP